MQQYCAEARRVIWDLRESRPEAESLAGAALQVHIGDDGRGFVPEQAALASGHFGLAVMQESAERFGGKLRLTSQPGRGTLVEATIPAVFPKSK